MSNTKYVRDLPVLYDEETLKKRCKELGAQITHDYRDSKDLLIVGILRGAFIFLADLVRCIDLPMSIDFMVASSYGNNLTSGGVVSIKKDIALDLTGKDVILVDDIFDTGYTLHKIKGVLEGRGARSVRFCTLLDKKAHRAVDDTLDYCGFEIDDEFVLGYGLDYEDHYRNVPYVSVITGTELE